MKRLRPLLVVMALTVVTLACQGGFTLFGQTPAPDIQTKNTPANDTAVQTLEAVPPAATPQLPPVTSDLSDMEQLQIALYQRVSPGIVSVQTINSESGVQGSGFVYDQDGHVITNYHVVQDADQIEIDFPSGIKVFGEVIGIDIDSDIAVLQVDVPSDQLYPLPLGDSDNLQIGQTVFAIGNPYGLTGTMTVGIVSAKGRTLDSLRSTDTGQAFSAGDLIQTDASINPGNSGGPLLNLAGEVIGINRAIRLSGITNSGEPINTGIGFAISVNILKRVVPDLISKGSYDYPYVGISARPELTLIEAQALGLPQTSGAYVVEVVNGGPADKAGLQAGSQPTEYVGLNSGGDLIIAIDDQPVRNFGEFLGYLMTQKSPGDTVLITFLRANEEMEVELILETRP